MKMNTKMMTTGRASGAETRSGGGCVFGGIQNLGRTTALQPTMAHDVIPCCIQSIVGRGG